MRDSKVNIKAVRAISPYDPSATGTKTGQVLDTAGYDSCTFVIQAGAQTTTGITVTPIIKHGTVTGTMTSVADTHLIGTEAAAAALLAGATGANGVAKIGYAGPNRYVQCNIVIAGATTGFYSAVAILGKAKKAPV
jgi:hypothetical protein